MTYSNQSLLKFNILLTFKKIHHSVLRYNKTSLFSKFRKQKFRHTFLRSNKANFFQFKKK